MESTKKKYHRAAIAYFLYGLVYLSGAVYLAVMDVVARSGWAWFVVGLVFILVLPPLIWYEYKWVTRILSILVGLRVLGLGRTILTGDAESVPMPGGWQMPIRYGAIIFLFVAAGTAYMLARAGWQSIKSDLSS